MLVLYIRFRTNVGPDNPVFVTTGPEGEVTLSFLFLITMSVCARERACLGPQKSSRLSSRTM